MSNPVRSEKTQTLLALQLAKIDEAQAVQIIDDLIDVIRYHNEQYYVYAQPIIADVQYDHLFSLLVELEKKFPKLIRTNSPTQRLAIDLQEGFTKAEHGGYFLLSLQNTYNAEQIRDRDDFVKRQLGDETPYSFVVEPKYDGSSLHLVYRKGHLVQAISRGDGSVGEDITENIKAVRSLPLFLPQAKSIAELRFRAEIVMPKNAFEELNIYQKEEDLPLFANSRNATAGTLRQLDPQIVAQRNLVVFIHELINRKEIAATSHVEVLEKVKERGLFVYGYTLYSTIDEVINYCIDEKTQQKLLKENIEFDGLVIKVNELGLREQLGTTAHHPRWAIAYKFPAQQVATKLHTITYQVGRTGVITPVANLDSVQLSGATISKATLHNFDYIQDNDIRVGDFVRVQRSGEVIPYVVGPIIARRDGKEQPFQIPKNCPSCGSVLEHMEGEVAWYCKNNFCDAQIKERLKHFVSKGCMNISGLGESIIELMVDAKLVYSYVDLYTLQLPENRLKMASLPGLAEKKIHQILTQIELSKKNNIRRLLHALGISFVGKKVATMLEGYLADQNVTSYTQFIKALTDTEALTNLFGFGPQTVNSLVSFFSDSLNQNIIKSLIDLGVNILPASRAEHPSVLILTGTSIVITGTLPFPREQIAMVLEQAGAKVTTAVTGKTSWVLAGEKAGSKQEKAQSLGIPVYTREEAIQNYPLLTELQKDHKSSRPDEGAPHTSKSLFS